MTEMGTDTDGTEVNMKSKLDIVRETNRFVDVIWKHLPRTFWYTLGHFVIMTILAFGATCFDGKGDGCDVTTLVKAGPRLINIVADIHALAE